MRRLKAKVDANCPLQAGELVNSCGAVIELLESLTLRGGGVPLRNVDWETRVDQLDIDEILSQVVKPEGAEAASKPGGVPVSAEGELGAAALSLSPPLSSKLASWFKAKPDPKSPRAAPGAGFPSRPDPKMMRSPRRSLPVVPLTKVALSMQSTSMEKAFIREARESEATKSVASDDSCRASCDADASAMAAAAAVPSSPCEKPVDERKGRPTLSPLGSRLVRPVSLDTIPEPAAMAVALARNATTDWNNDTLALHEASQGHALLLLGTELLGSFLCVDPVTLRRFLYVVERDYGDNAYHNCIHGADVLLTTHLFMEKNSLWARCSRSEQFATYLSAIIHDFDHPGTTNAHEVKVESDLAVRYSDDTVLERHHLASALGVMRVAGQNVLSSLSPTDARAARSWIIHLVLQTDLRRHAEFLRRLRAIEALGFKRMVRETAVCAAGDWRTPLLDSKVEASLVCSTALKFADLGHATKPLEQHLAWTKRLMEEFYCLGDRERALGVPVSALCNRWTDTNIPKMQVGYIKFICMPFFNLVADLVDPFAVPHKRLNENFFTWLQESLKFKAAPQQRDKPPCVKRAISFSVKHQPQPSTVAAARARRGSSIVLTQLHEDGSVPPLVPRAQASLKRRAPRRSSAVY